MEKKCLLIVAIGFMAGLMSCSQNDESDDTNTGKQKITFVGGNPDNNASAKIATRTSFDASNYDFLDENNTDPINFNWTPGDYIFVKWGATDNDVTKMYATTDVDGTTKISGEQHQAYFSGYIGSTADILTKCKIYYPGCNSDTYNKVTINATQTQSALNNSTHICLDGDCAVATLKATTGSTKYGFTLDHKSTCFVVIPHMHDNGESATIKSLVVSSSNSNLAGTYTMSEDGTLTLKSNGSKTVTLNTNNFVIKGKKAGKTNTLFIIVAPSTETSTLTFTLNFSYSSAGGAYSKTITINDVTWEAGYFYPLTMEIPSSKS